MINDFLLQKEIERRVIAEAKCTNYNIATELLTIDSANFNYCTEGDFLFLLSRKIEVPITQRIKLMSADNYQVLSKAQLEQITTSLYSFRGTLTVKSENYGTTFIPYQLEFLRVTPSK